jgi:hypothetical protein
MTDNRLAPLRDDYLPRDRQAALWAEIRTVIEMAGLTYKAAQVRPLSINSLTGADDWQIEVVWMPAGMRIAGPDDRAANWRRRIFIGENAAAIMAQVHTAFPPKAATIVNIRDFAVGGVKPRPWGPFEFPADVRNVTRSGAGSSERYANPYPLHSTAPEERDRVLAAYAALAIARHAADPTWIRDLDGFRLACWCRPPEGFRGRLLCHAQILVGIRDGIEPRDVE